MKFRSTPKSRLVLVMLQNASPHVKREIQSFYYSTTFRESAKIPTSPKIWEKWGTRIFLKFRGIPPPPWSIAIFNLRGNVWQNLGLQQLRGKILETMYLRLRLQADLLLPSPRR